MARLGAERLMWGSDWPWTQHEGRYSYTRTLEWFNERIGDEDTRSVVHWETPTDLFRF
jgi:predicted TIM-barrel fold metal-dependent hydrolase